MKTKHQIKQDLQIKEIVNKRRKIIMYIVAVILIINLLFLIGNIFFSLNAKHTSIKDNKGNTLTTEICSQWYNMSNEEQLNLTKFYYNKQEIPLTIINEVCPQWLEIKKEIDLSRSNNPNNIN